jgi:hypothetical protein
MNEQSMNECPEARSEGLLIERVGDELVVYDTTTNEAHALKPLAAGVFEAADGSTSVAGISLAAATSLERDVSVADVQEALVELDRVGLLELSESGGGISRRRLLQVGGAAAAGVMVTSALVPAFAAASTTCDVGTLSQFGILVEFETHYYFVVAKLAGKNNGTTVLGACKRSLGGNLGGTGEDQVCWHNLDSLPGPNGTYYPLASGGLCNDTINFTVSGSNLVYTLPPGATLVAWWVHQGGVCAGPNSPTTPTTVNASGNTYTTDPCGALQ